jgi:hypothetical protein
LFKWQNNASVCSVLPSKKSATDQSMCASFVVFKNTFIPVALRYQPLPVSSTNSTKHL